MSNRRTADADAAIAELKRRNPELRIKDDGNGSRPAPYRLTEARTLHTPAPEPAQETDDGSPLAAKFEYLWRMWQGPELTKEHRFHSVRKWRLDYYHAPTRTAIELEGGIYSGGRHTRTAGYQGDIEKYNAAAMQGITVLRLGTGQVDHQHVTEIIDYISRKEVQP